jgi:hypothetical protein
MMPRLLHLFLLLLPGAPCFALTAAESREIAAEVEALKAELPQRIDKSTTMVAATYEPALALLTYWANVELRVPPETLAAVLRRTQPPRTCVNLRDMFEAGLSMTWVYTATDGREIGTIYLTKANCEQWW